MVKIDRWDGEMGFRTYLPSGCVVTNYCASLHLPWRRNTVKILPTMYGNIMLTSLPVERVERELANNLYLAHLSQNCQKSLSNRTMARPRWLLYLEAWNWRILSRVGFFLHKRIARPLPIHPSFSRLIKSTLSPLPGYINLVFYTPKNYSLSPSTLIPQKYPVVINFHGGGFTIGHPTEDARWASALVRSLNCLVVSVDYRRAPEAPFPTAVEDGADAILWLLQHADELSIDVSRMAISGFSAGGNLSFTTLIRLQTALQEYSVQEKPLSHIIRAVVAWYPSTDFTRTRIERRRTNIRQDKELPHFFTKLFDASYLHPPHNVDMSDPLLSPAVAADHIIKEGLPKDIIIYTCEWDELRDEAERFRDRLRTIEKNVHYTMIEGVSHAWDKNVFTENPLREKYYREACEKLAELFEDVEME